MAKYQNQFLGTSSYNGDILFWNVNMFKPILNFNASVSPLPLQPKKAQEVDNFLAEGLRAGKFCMENQEWAYKPPVQPPGPRGRTVANANLQRNLMSAPPVMKHPRDRQPERLAPPQKTVCFGTPKLLRKPYGKQSIIRDTQREEFQKILLQSNASVEKVGHAQAGSGREQWGWAGKGRAGEPGGPASSPQALERHGTGEGRTQYSVFRAAVCGGSSLGVCGGLSRVPSWLGDRRSSIARNRC
ncbi:uncharacterized protein LOC117800587 [Ailuropoda melanoleuca]|uniref:uncharacterized protein LOC117800587 n=1 Tax=Ailuropoda melanoleuca TaxID=9646 RepID=UPI0014943047|nr:uncharacterized protein LOC117800587 [Ailuropoda melanoleuca]